MKSFRHALLLVSLAGGALGLSAGELSAEVQAKFIKVIVASTGGRIACGDPALRSALTAAGVTVDSGAQVQWTTSPAEAKMLKGTGKLLIAGRRDLMASVAIVLEEEGGRPKIRLNTTNLRASSVQVGDAVLKLGEKI